MADTAAHLVDRVLPIADYRQSTLSFPRWLRIRRLRDSTLVSELLTAFVRIVFAYHRRRARTLGHALGHAGAVTSAQRFGSFVNANLHGQAGRTRRSCRSRACSSRSRSSRAPPTAAMRSRSAGATRCSSVLS